MSGGGSRRKRLGRFLRRRVETLMDRAHRDREAGPASVTFEGRAPIEVEHGQTVLAVARSAGVDLSHYCGGTCSCGTCRIEVVSGADMLTPSTPREQMVLGHERSTSGDRLACQARVVGAVTVRIPDWF